MGVDYYILDCYSTCRLLIRKCHSQLDISSDLYLISREIDETVVKWLELIRWNLESQVGMPEHDIGRAILINQHPMYIAPHSDDWKHHKVILMWIDILEINRCEIKRGDRWRFVVAPFWMVFFFPFFLLGLLKIFLPWLLVKMVGDYLMMTCLENELACLFSLSYALSSTALRWFFCSSSCWTRCFDVSKSKRKAWRPCCWVCVCVV